MWKVVGIGAAVMVIIAVIFLAIQQHNQWTRWCENQGGHVVDHTTSSTVTTFDSKGTPHTGTSWNTTYYCLNESGGIIDIEN